MLANNRAPAHSVHSDFTATGALHHLESVINDPEERERLFQGRAQIINIWRPLKTVQRDPLCNWRLEEGGVMLPHSAFVVPESVDGPARESTEIKILVFS